MSSATVITFINQLQHYRYSYDMPKLMMIRLSETSMSVDCNRWQLSAFAGKDCTPPYPCNLSCAGVAMMKVRRKSDGHVIGGWAAEYKGHAKEDGVEKILHSDLDGMFQRCVLLLWCLGLLLAKPASTCRLF